MENDNIEKPFNFVGLVGKLAEKTKNFSYLVLYLSLLGISPESIDKLISKHKLEKNSELGMWYGK